MSALLSPELHDHFWEDLLSFIEEKRVIPIIGPELLVVKDGDREVRFNRWIAERLAASLPDLRASELPENYDLNAVVSLHVRNRGEREDLYPRIHRILRGATIAPPEALQALARIPDFDLFVSMTFDSLLVDALNLVRFGGEKRTEQVSYSPHEVHDLSKSRSEMRLPCVFHLLGRGSSSPDYAICDEDMLEFLHSLQDKQRTPLKLFDELRSHHLLILGCSYGDWLTRFFLRTARTLALSQNRKRLDVWVDNDSASDPNLANFLKSYSANTRVLSVDPGKFVAELERRWQLDHPGTQQSPASSAAGPAEVVKAVPEGSIFLSYSSQDLGAAEKLAETLRDAGNVWFDKNQLRAGDDWARSIYRGMDTCALFVPVISRRALSEENRRSYFWEEWNYADRRTLRMSPDEQFVVPVVIDESRIDEHRHRLPDSFLKSHAEKGQDGRLSPEAVARFKELVRDHHRRQRS